VGWAALVAWITTAAGGLALAAQWVRHGGLRQGTGIRPARLVLHVLLAVAGLGLWVVFVVTGEPAWGWFGLALLAGVIGVGLSMLVIWLRGRSGKEATELPAESAFPVPLVLLHGALGLTTFVLALVAAITA
jgi:manganese efflux pump family protein